jgi:hypothetical protein
VVEGEQNTIHGLLLITSDPNPKVKVHFNIFGNMEPQRYRRYLDSYMRVSTIIDGDLGAYANEALRNFENVVSSIRDSVRQGPVSRLESVVGNWRQTAACSVLTFASALHLFQEQTLAKVRRANPDSPTTIIKAKEIFTREYDRAFYYRLVYRLRNVLRWCSGLTSLRFGGRGRGLRAGRTGGRRAW